MLHVVGKLLYLFDLRRLFEIRQPFPQVDNTVLLPRYDHPPLAETVLGIFFQAPPNFSIAHRVLFWSQFRESFPKVEERPTIDEVREGFGEGEFTEPQIRWQLFDSPPPARLFARSLDGQHVLQIQQDALHTNWRRGGTAADPYIRFEERLADFQEKIGRLEQFFRENRIGDFRPTSCVLTYINHLDFIDGQQGKVVDDAFSIKVNETSDKWLPSVEQANIRLSYRFPDNSGRLHAWIAPTSRDDDKKPVFRLQLTARSAPISEISVSSWFNLAHEWVVRGFTSLTTEKMHQQWKRTQ